MEYTDKDIVKHYGLYDLVESTWLRNSDGIVYAVTCPRVAEVQLAAFRQDYERYMSNWPEGSEVQQFGLEVREVKP